MSDNAETKVERRKLTATEVYVNFLMKHCSWDEAREDIQRMLDYIQGRTSDEQR